jgi:mannan endo-1,4-beta-mannosidase
MALRRWSRWVGVALLLAWAAAGCEGLPRHPGTPQVAVPPRTAAREDAPADAVFQDPADGYALEPPAGWRFDGSLLPDVARWDGPDATLRVFLQPVSGVQAAAEYVSYSNRSVDQGWNGIRLLDGWQRGDTWFRRWSRPAMPLLRPDEREYAEWDRVLAPDRVLTVMVNATPAAFPAAYAAAEQAWRSARAIPRQGVNRYAVVRGPSRPNPLVAPEGPVQWGIFEPKVQPERPSLAAVREREAQVGYRFRVVMVYLALGQPFPAELLRKAWAEGRLVELTLQSWSVLSDADRQLPYGHPASRTGYILQGRYDDYFRSFARAAADLGLPFFFRWDNEMNGDWDPWSAFQWGKDADIYVAAWRHVHDLFLEEGAANAAWVWNPNNDDLPPYRWNAAPLYYPGDAYVDWVGLTAYNLGDAQPGSAWRSFEQAYRATYQRDLLLYPGKPLIVTEFASHDSPGDKAAWIRDAVAALRSMPAVRYAVWWDHVQGNLHYRLDQPPAALAAFREALRR